MELVCTGLPPRQSQAIVLAAQGMSEKVSARMMGCSVDNIRNLRAVVYYKWHAVNVAAAIAEGFKRGHLKYLPILFICMAATFSPHGEARPVRRPVRTSSYSRVINMRQTS